MRERSLYSDTQLQSYKNIFCYYSNTMFEKLLLTNATVQHKQISHSWFCGGPSPAWIGSKYFDLSWTLWWDGIEERLWGYGTASMLISVKTNFWHLCHFRYDHDERQKIDARSIFIYHHNMQHIEQIQINGIVHWSMVNTKVVCGTDFVTDNLRGLTRRKGWSDVTS